MKTHLLIKVAGKIKKKEKKKVIVDVQSFSAPFDVTPFNHAAVIGEYNETHTVGTQPLRCK